jgi:predicted outer membrane protein
MKTNLYAITMMLLLGCSSSLSYQEALNKNQRKMGSIDQVNDAHFLVDAKSFNLAEMEMSKLAITKGYSSSVVNYAKENLKIQTDVAKDLQRIARKAKAILPTEMKSEHQTLFTKLSSEGRAEFDGAYVESLRDLIKENSSLYSDQASKAYDDEIRSFAAHKLGLFRTQAEAISQVSDQLIDTNRN